MLRKIKSQTELAEFAPQLIELHSSLEGLWEPDDTSEEFVLGLIEQFSEDSDFYGDFDSATGKISYFAVIIPQSDTKVLFWLFYMNKDFRHVTKAILEELKMLYKARGFTTAYSQSTRTGSSYERWLSKFGAEKLAITYRFKL